MNDYKVDAQRGAMFAADPPVTVAAPIVEKITESHWQLKLVVHDYLVFMDGIIPFKDWSPDGFFTKMAKLIGYTGGK